MIEQHFLLLPTVLIVKRTTEIYCDYYWLYANSQWISLFLDLFMTETLFSRMLRNLNWPRVSSNNVSHLGFLRVYCVYSFIPLKPDFWRYLCRWIQHFELNLFPIWILRLVTPRFLWDITCSWERFKPAISCFCFHVFSSFFFQDQNYQFSFCLMIPLPPTWR